MTNTNPSLIHIVATSGSRIPIFTGRPIDLKPWLAALKKKQRIYKLNDSEVKTLAYDFSDGIVLEWIGNYLDDHPDIPSKDLFEELTAQYGEFVNSTDAARALVKIKQKKDESLAELASRMSNLAKLAYRDSELREGSAVQVQLAEFFIDGVSSPFIKEDVARANPATLSEALSSARESERLYERLRGCQEIKEKFTNRFPGRTGWRHERVGPHTLLRAPKSEDYRGKWSGESRGCYSFKKSTQRDKEGNVPQRSSQRWNRDKNCCPSSTEEDTNYRASAKQKTKAPTKTKIDIKKYNRVKSSKKEIHKCQNYPKSQNRDIVKNSKRKGAGEYEFLTQG